MDPSLIRLNFQAPRRNAPSKLRASVSISHYFVYNFVYNVSSIVGLLSMRKFFSNMSTNLASFN